MLKVPPDGHRMSSKHEVAQDELEHAAREIAYQMAYGLSHELNNPLANIAARGRLLAESEPDTHKRQQLAAIVDQAMRGCEMIADLMLYARPPELKVQAVELSGLVERLVGRVRGNCNAQTHSVNFSAHLDGQSSRVLVDPQALEEALWAVLRNALEATKSKIDVVMQADLADHTWVIEITDDGPGLSQAGLELAFHPFFSGREAGRGIGLGLSKARRLIEMQSGSLTIANSQPSGCRVRVSLKFEN